MNNAMNLLAPIIARAAVANPQEEGDYFDGEGFLVCGKCHTRRETVIPVPDFDGTGEQKTMKVRVSCQCRRDAEEANKAARKREKDMEAIKNLKKQSLMDERLRNATFETFEQTKSNAKILKLCKRYGRLMKVLDAWGKKYDQYFDALTKNPEADYAREKMDRCMKAITGEKRFIPFEKRYDWLPDIDYGKK